MKKKCGPLSLACQPLRMKLLLVLCALALSCQVLQAWHHHPNPGASIHTTYIGRLHQENECGHNQCVGSFSGTNVFHHCSDGTWCTFSQRCKDLLGGIMGMLSNSCSSCGGRRTALDLDMKSRIVNHNLKCHNQHVCVQPCVQPCEQPCEQPCVQPGEQPCVQPCEKPCTQICVKPTVLPCPETCTCKPPHHHHHHPHHHHHHPHHHHPHHHHHHSHHHRPHHHHPHHHHHHHHPHHHPHYHTTPCSICQQSPHYIHPTECSMCTPMPQHHTPCSICDPPLPIEEVVTVRPVVVVPQVEVEEVKHKHHHHHHDKHHHHRHHHGRHHHHRKEEDDCDE